MRILKFFTVKKITYIAIFLALISLYLLASSFFNIKKINEFNKTVSKGEATEIC